VAEDFDRETEELVEQYILYLRGRGPEPSIPESRMNEITALFETVHVLAESEPALPELEEDPVAIRLGIVGHSSGGGTPQDDTPSPEGLGSIEAALREVGLRFGDDVNVDLEESRSFLAPWTGRIATCSSLGETVAVLIAPLDDWTDEPDNVAVNFRRHPELTAVALVSTDAERAVVLTAADSNRVVDPALGWLSPRSPSLPEPFVIALSRHFERTLPRWDQVTRLDDLLGAHDAGEQLHEVVATAVRDTLAAKPRLDYKKEALRSLQALDPGRIVELVSDVQRGRLATEELGTRVADLVKSIPS
jgi:hypothetical protein